VTGKHDCWLCGVVAAGEAVRKGTVRWRSRTVATGREYQSTSRPLIENGWIAIGGELNAQYTMSYRPTGAGGGTPRVFTKLE